MSKLTDNTSGLQTILESLQNKTVGGGGVETCIVTIEPYHGVASPISPTYYYTDAETMTIESISTQNAVLTIPKNSIIAIIEWNSQSSASGSCSQIFYFGGNAAYQITGDCKFTYS